MAYRRFLLVPMAVFAVLLAGTASTDADPLADNPQNYYAIIAVAMTDTNAKLHSNLDPIDVNGAEIALAKAYGALITAGFEDKNITIMYNNGRMEPDWGEKEAAEWFSRMKKNHFGGNRLSSSRQNIEQVVNAVKGKLDENDQFLFYVLCHGAANGMHALTGSNWGLRSMKNLFSDLKSKTNYFCT
ncbi:MAG: hypothetical protein ACYTAF_08545, partial [Planctomycetota bacterium]